MWNRAKLWIKCSWASLLCMSPRMNFSPLSLRWISLAKCTRYQVCSGLLCQWILLLNIYKREKLLWAGNTERFFADKTNKRLWWKQEENRYVEQSSWVLHCSKELSYVVALEMEVFSFSFQLWWPDHADETFSSMSSVCYALYVLSSLCSSLFQQSQTYLLSEGRSWLYVGIKACHLHVVLWRTVMDVLKKAHTLYKDANPYRQTYAWTRVSRLAPQSKMLVLGLPSEYQPSQGQALSSPPPPYTRAKLHSSF